MRTTDMDNLLICDHCSQKGCHLYCLKPKLRVVPDSPWYCDYCVRDFNLRSLVQLAYKLGEELPPRDRRPDPNATQPLRRSRRRLTRQAESRDGQTDIGEPLIQVQITVNRERSRTRSRRVRREAESRAQRHTENRSTNRISRIAARRRRESSSSHSFKPEDDISKDEEEDKISKLLSSPNGTSSSDVHTQTIDPVPARRSGQRLRRVGASGDRARSIPDRERENDDNLSPINKENVMMPRIPDPESESESSEKDKVAKVFKPKQKQQNSEVNSNRESSLEQNLDNIFGPKRRNKRSKIIPEDEESQSTSETRVKSNSRRNRKLIDSPTSEEKMSIPYNGYLGAQKALKEAKERKSKGSSKIIPQTTTNSGNAMSIFQISCNRSKKLSDYRPLFSEYQGIAQQTSNSFLYG